MRRRTKKAEIKNAQADARKIPEKIISTKTLCGSEVNIPHFALNFKEKSGILKNLLIMTTNYVNMIMYTTERAGRSLGAEAEKKYHIWCDVWQQLAKSCFCRKSCKIRAGKYNLLEFQYAGCPSLPSCAIRTLAAPCGKKPGKQSRTQAADCNFSDPERWCIDE